MSQSALSHAMKALEERLGVRLLSRTTRSVSTTEAGETLLRSVRPALEEIASGVDAASALRGKPSGTVRITATKHAVSSVVMPVLPGFLASHPDIRVDILVDDNLTDIVANRIDAPDRIVEVTEVGQLALLAQLVDVRAGASEQRCQLRDVDRWTRSHSRGQWHILDT